MLAGFSYSQSRRLGCVADVENDRLLFSARELFQVFPMNACSDPRDAMFKVFLGYVALKIDHYAEDVRRK